MTSESINILTQNCKTLISNIEKSNQHVSTLEGDLKIQQQNFDLAKKANESLKRELITENNKLENKRQQKINADRKKQKFKNSGLSDDQLFEIRERIVGAIALDIRENWKDCNERLDLISQLSGKMVTSGDLYNYGGGYVDGRYFRDKWQGPYATQITEKELKLFDINESIFECDSWRKRD